MPSSRDRSGVRRALGALVLALGIAGCSGDDGGDGSAGGTTTSGDGDTEAETTTGGEWASLDDRPCPEDSILTYENFGGPFMISQCTGCHHAGLPEGERQMAPLAVNFDTVEAIRAQADRVWARAADQNATMPPAGAPGADERAMLGEWLACGAP